MASPYSQNGSTLLFLWLPHLRRAFDMDELYRLRQHREAAGLLLLSLLRRRDARMAIQVSAAFSKATQRLLEQPPPLRPPLWPIFCPPRWPAKRKGGRRGGW